MQKKCVVKGERERQTPGKGGMANEGDARKSSRMGQRYFDAL